SPAASTVPTGSGVAVIASGLPLTASTTLVTTAGTTLVLVTVTENGTAAATLVAVSSSPKVLSPSASLVLSTVPVIRTPRPLANQACPFASQLRPAKWAGIPWLL